MKVKANRFQLLLLVLIFFCTLSGQRAVAQTSTSDTFSANTGQPETAEAQDASTSMADQAFYILIDWGGGLLGLVEAPGLVFAAIGGIYAVYVYLKDLKLRQKDRVDNQWQNEYDRRRTEKNFIGTLRQTRYSHLFDPDQFKRPFFFGGDMGMVVARHADTQTQPALGSSQQLLENEQAHYQLFRSIRTAQPDISRVATILQQHPNLIDATDEEGNTLLHYAAILGNIELADLLIHKGADITILNNNGHSPLLIAANSQGYNRNVVFNSLLDSLVSVSDRELSALFHIVAQRRDTDGLSGTLMRQLIQRGLHHRFRLRNIPKCESVNLRNVANCQSENGLTLIHEAAIALNSELIELLIDQGLLTVDELDDAGNTPLHYAVQHDYTEKQRIVCLLLDRGAEINAENDRHETALHIAVNRNNPSMVRLLLKRNANVNTPNPYGDTPIFAACRSAGKVALAECILAESQPELINCQGQTPLHLAVTLPAGAELVRALLNCERINNREIRDQKDNKGKTAHEVACEAARNELDKPPPCVVKVCVNPDEAGGEEVIDSDLEEPL